MVLVSNIFICKKLDSSFTTMSMEKIENSWIKKNSPWYLKFEIAIHEPYMLYEYCKCSI